MVVLTVLAVGLVGLILMSTVLQAQSFESARLDRQADRAADPAAGASPARSTGCRAPANVASRAIAIGMVPNANPAFLRLSDGKVLGKPAAGRARQQHQERDPMTPDAARRASR